MTTRSLRILMQINWTTGDVARLWDGAGPFRDGAGNVWKGTAVFSGVDGVEQAINGEAYSLDVALTGVSREAADLAWLSYSNDEIIGSTVKLLLQACDAQDQPVGSPETRFTGTIDDIVLRDTVEGVGPTSIISVTVVNRFTVRRLRSGAVLSDADQRARAAILNPSGTPDRFCERVPLMNDKTVVWPRWN
jgi:hypothetical protein